MSDELTLSEDEQAAALDKSITDSLQSMTADALTVAYGHALQHGTGYVRFTVTRVHDGIDISVEAVDPDTIEEGEHSDSIEHARRVIDAYVPKPTTAPEIEDARPPVAGEEGPSNA